MILILILQFSIQVHSNLKITMRNRIRLLSLQSIVQKEMPIDLRKSIPEKVKVARELQVIISLFNILSNITSFTKDNEILPLKMDPP